MWAGFDTTLEREKALPNGQEGNEMWQVLPRPTLTFSITFESSIWDIPLQSSLPAFIYFRISDSLLSRQAIRKAKSHELLKRI